MMYIRPLEFIHPAEMKICWWESKMVHTLEGSWEISYKVKLTLLFDKANKFLVIYPDKIKTDTDYKMCL
jgi:hypothetical protein